MRYWHVSGSTRPESRPSGDVDGTETHGYQPAGGMEILWREGRDLFVVLEHDGTIIDVSTGWERALGWTRQESVGRTWASFVHPDDIATRQTAAELGAAAIAGQDERRYRCKDGSVRWLLWRASPVEDRWYAVAQDISAARTSWRRAGIAERRFSLLWSIVDTGLLIVDHHGRVIRANDAACLLSGRSHHELVTDRALFSWLIQTPRAGRSVRTQVVSDCGLQPRPVVATSVVLDPELRLLLISESRHTSPTFAAQQPHQTPGLRNPGRTL